MLGVSMCSGTDRRLRSLATIGSVLVLGVSIPSSAAPPPCVEAPRPRHEHAQEPLILDVLASGAIAVGKDLLDDPEHPDGHLALRRWLAKEAARIRSKDRPRDAAKRAEASGVSVRIQSESVAPFEPVQAILECCFHRDVEIEIVQLEVAGAEIEPALVLDAGEDDDDSVRLRVAVEQAGKRVLVDSEEESAESQGFDADRVLSYALGAKEVEGLPELATALEHSSERAEARRIVIDPRRGTTCAEIGAVIEAVFEAGCEDLALAPAWWAVRERSVERWGLITRGEWEEVYRRMTPEHRRAKTLERFLADMEYHEYRDVRDLHAFSMRGNLAFVSLQVKWTPHRPDLDTDPVILPNELELVEAWFWIEGEWFWAWNQRRSEFLAKHPELAGEIEDD